jgi:hypothetical protein
MKRSNSNYKEKGRMGQSVIKKEWDYKYPIFSSMWPAAPRQEGGGDFRFFSIKIQRKTPKLLGLYKL